MLRCAAAAAFALLAGSAGATLSPDAEVIVGGVRVQALSETLLRIEPKGPMGFEDNTTFMVVSRDFAGVPIQRVGSTKGTVTTLTTDKYTISIDQPSAPPAPPPAPPGPAPMCSATENTDIAGGRRISTCKESQPSCLPAGATQQQCCDGCTAAKAKGCVAWIYAPGAKQCWLMSSADSTRKAAGRITGGKISASGGGGPKPTHIKVTVASKATGATLWEIDDLDSVSQDLNWPSPGNSTVYVSVQQLPFSAFCCVWC